MVSPPGKNGKLPAGVLVAAKEAGVKEIYKVVVPRQLRHLPMGQNRFLPLIKLLDQVIFLWHWRNGKCLAMWTLI